MALALTGRSVVFTGTLLNLTRPAAQAKALEAGAKVEKSVTKHVNLVVKGCDVDDSNKKLARAVSQGVEVISEEEFFARVGLETPAQGFDILAVDQEKNRKRIWRTEPKELREERKAEKAAAKERRKATRAARKVEELSPCVETRDASQPIAVASSEPSEVRGPKAPITTSRPKRSLVDFSNKTIVFLGSLGQLSRLASVTLAMRSGALVSGRLSKRTSFVVVGQTISPSARSRILHLFPQVKVLDEQQFLNLFHRPNHPSSDDESIETLNSNLRLEALDDIVLEQLKKTPVEEEERSPQYDWAVQS